MTTKTAKLIVESDSIFAKYGLTVDEAINKFLEKTIKERAIPFEIAIFEKIPNAETLEALAELKEMKKNPQNHKSYTSVGELFKDMGIELDADN